MQSLKEMMRQRRFKPVSKLECLLMLHICNHISALGIGMFYIIYEYIYIDTKIIVSYSNNKSNDAEDNERDRLSPTVRIMIIMALVTRR